MKKILIVLLLIILVGCEYLGDSGSNIKITFVNGEEISEVNFEEISEFPTPQKDGFTFLGWYLEETFETKFSIGEVIESVTLYAKFEVTKYTITFYNLDGSILEEQILEHNQEIVAPVAPNILGYTFNGWNKEFDVAKENLDIIALYSVIKYRVVFLDNFGEVIKEEFVNHNENATAPVDTNLEHYKFIGWDKSFKNVTSDLEIKALYEKNLYTVTFRDYDGQDISTQNVEYQSDATAPTNPSRVGYSFKGWDQDINNISQDLVVNAIYEINKYKVEFRDYNGVVISTQSVDYMESAIKPSDPTRQDYYFAGWDQ